VLDRLDPTVSTAAMVCWKWRCLGLFGWTLVGGEVTDKLRVRN
jgi:hypothetical protein